MTARIVPCLKTDAIERDAERLLDDFARRRRVTLAPPIPIEDIVEKHLKLGVEFDDTHHLFNLPRAPGGAADILGAISFNDRRIVIAQSLDLEERPALEGRYRYTLAHEGGGHWRLHRYLFDGGLIPAPMPELAPDAAPAASVVCRSGRARDRIEWQADYYASCLLMPRALVRDAWGAADGIDLVKSLAQRFAVSAQAMGIRLRQLGLFTVETANPFAPRPAG
ncbi:MAG: ImmA/IrrE family metallo-endopeptidase [Alphaproteobacteria bacterium]|nr:ImmA/IrrE family metallo-endopeptidase [Alphaproteobacteria bacterium]